MTNVHFFPGVNEKIVGKCVFVGYSERTENRLSALKNGLLILWRSAGGNRDTEMPLQDTMLRYAMLCCCNIHFSPQKNDVT